MSAIEDIAAERQRQIDAELFTEAHDDNHPAGELAEAAACYAAPDLFERGVRQVPVGWPWALKWWKPTDRRRDLVKAGALIAAEIDKLDRAAAK
jgi:hypothetical protein